MVLRLLEGDVENLKKVIEADGGTVSLDRLKEAVETVIDLLDEGKLRVCEKVADEWVVHSWIQKAILEYFRTHDMLPMGSASCGALNWCDKVPSKFENWGYEHFAECNVRAVPGSFVRKSAYIGRSVVLMPSFVNVGAYVGEGTMVDTWSTIGSCAQIGNNCHISGGVGIGGVLEPLGAKPVVIEDGCFIGARSEIVEGVRVREGAVLGMGCFIGASTRILDRDKGEVLFGEVPAYSVVVPGSLPSTGGVSLYCVVIVKKVDSKTRSKVAINDILRGV